MTKTTATTRKRKADKDEIEKVLGLPEFGEDITVKFTTPGGYTIAEGYTRIVYGDRGPYVEFNPEQIEWGNFMRGRKRKPCHYYLQWFSPDGVMIYDQLKTVKYADYLLGMVYVSPYEVDVQQGIEMS